MPERSDGRRARGGAARPRGDRAREAIAGDVPPPAATRSPAGRPATAPPFPDLSALAGLLELARGSLPPDLQRQLQQALRELLIALRAVLDYSIDRLEPGRSLRRRRWRTSRSPDKLDVVPSLQKRLREIPPEHRMAGIAAVVLVLSMGLPWYQRTVDPGADSDLVSKSLNALRRLHVRRGGDPARRRRRALPDLGAHGGQGLPPAGRRRARDLAGRRLGGRAADLARVRPAGRRQRRASSSGSSGGSSSPSAPPPRSSRPGRACAPRTGRSRPTRPRTSTGRAPPRGRAAARATAGAARRDRRHRGPARPARLGRRRPRRPGPAPPRTGPRPSPSRTPTSRPTASSERRVAELFGLRLNNVRVRRATAGT